MFKPTLKSLVGEDICLLLQLDNHAANYICECGDASELSVRDCQNAAAIFVSHTHIDHFVNFDTILRHQIGVGKQIVLCGAPNIIEQARNRIKSYTWNLIEEGAISYEIREVIDEKSHKKCVLKPPFWDIEQESIEHTPVLYSNERFEARYTLLDHKIPTVAFLFREYDSSNIDLTASSLKGGAWVRDLKLAYERQELDAEIKTPEKTYRAEELFHLIQVKKGDSVGVIMDHAASEENHARIKELFTGCNKVFIECFYKESDKQLAYQNHHSYTAPSADVMRLCGVLEPIPVHFSRKYDAQEIEILLAEFAAALGRQDENLA